MLEEDLTALKHRFKEVVLRLEISRTKEIEMDNSLTNYVNSL